MNTLRALCCLMLLTPPALAGDLRIADVTVSSAEGRHQVELTLSWANGWRGERSHDAAWLVVRLSETPLAGPLQLAASGHSAPEGEVEFVVSEDRLGVFVQAAAPRRGDVNWQVALTLAGAPAGPVEVWGVEMVHVPAGGFELGDDDPLALSFSAFSSMDGDGEPAVFEVSSEAAIPVGKAAGQLSYDPGEVPQYRGDGLGPIPASYPKGTRGFYVMKYELTQGEYAAFLTALPDAWAQRRANVDLEGEEAATSTIKKTDAGYRAEVPTRPCNFVTWDDTCAFFDWMALRPMSEFEFEKASRGPVRPAPRDFPWGSADDSALARVVTQQRDLTRSTAAEEARLDKTTLAEFGASYYWVMDLSGSLWERVVSAGTPEGRRFAGSHGDGLLEETTGRATNADWPRGGADGRAAPGIGYRGGAEYFGPKVADDPTNPHSPVALRTYAAWDGAYRYKTYSARGCRSAPAGR